MIDYHGPVHDHSSEFDWLIGRGRFVNRNLRLSLIGCDSCFLIAQLRLGYLLAVIRLLVDEPTAIGRQAATVVAVRPRRRPRVPQRLLEGLGRGLVRYGQFVRPLPEGLRLPRLRFALIAL